MKIGYKRVSTIDQNTARQLDGIELDKIFEESVSGKNKDRPKLQEMIDFAREGDVIFVHSLDRLARNLIDLKTIINTCNQKGVGVNILKENLSFPAGTQSKNPTSELLLNILGALAEWERSIILERQREGIAIAKRDGRMLGRKSLITPEQVLEIQKMVGAGYKVRAIADKFSLSRQTVYTLLKNDRK